jgi:hypothetical protein
MLYWIFYTQILIFSQATTIQFDHAAEAENIVSHNLITTHTLHSVGFVVNVAAKLLICVECKIAIGAGQPEIHLQTVHHIPATAYNKKALKAAVLQFNLNSTLPPPPSDCTVIEGLEIHDCLACSECSSIYSSKDTLKRHYKSDHSDIAFPAVLNTVHAQHYNNGKGRPWFKVIPTSIPPSNSPLSPAAIAVLFQQEINTLFEDSTYRPDIRNVTPWLRVSEWHLRVAGHKIPDLRNYVALPTPGEFPGLQDAIHCLFAEKAEPLFDSVSVLIRQHLNSPNPSEYVASCYIAHC